MAKKNKVPADHVCDKGDIKWASRPDATGGDDGNLPWRGTCTVCKRKVYELYVPQDELYDAETNDYVEEFGEE